MNKSQQTFLICGNLLEKKTLAKEKCLTQLHSVFFINIIKDLQCIYPSKICMKCYVLMNAASKRNSTISPKTYENWCPEDDHLWGTCVRVTQSCKGGLGKIKNTSRNYRRDRPSLSKLFCSQEDLDIFRAKCPHIYIYTYVGIYIYMYLCMYRKEHMLKNNGTPTYVYSCAISATIHWEGLLYWNPANIHFALYA